MRNSIHLFWQHLRNSPLLFFIGLKIDAAKAVLMHSTLSIKRIGTEVGYKDQFHFSAQFKRRTGKSPRAFPRAYQTEARREFAPLPRTEIRNLSKTND